MIHSDSYFYIGKTHDICEDYAIHGGWSTLAYAIVCDGCSSSPKTDIGARHLALCAEDYILNLSKKVFDPIDGKSIIHAAHKTILTLGLGNERGHEALDSTLLVVKCSDVSWQTTCFGDGMFIMLRDDGRIEVTDIEYPSGAPYYLSYQLDSDRREAYIKEYGLKRIVREYIVGLDGEIDSSYESIDKEGETFIITGSTKHQHTILALSDGISSFQKLSEGRLSDINQQDILRKLVDFKGFKGQFIKRRMKRFLKNCATDGWQHLDDLSMAGVHHEAVT